MRGRLKRGGGECAELRADVASDDALEDLLRLIHHGKLVTTRATDSGQPTLRCEPDHTPIVTMTCTEALNVILGDRHPSVRAR